MCVANKIVAKSRRRHNLVWSRLISDLPIENALAEIQAQNRTPQFFITAQVQK